MQPIDRTLSWSSEESAVFDLLEQGIPDEAIIEAYAAPAEEQVIETARRANEFLNNQLNELAAEVQANIDALNDNPYFNSSFDRLVQLKGRIALFTEEQRTSLTELDRNRERIRKAKESIPNLTAELHTYQQLRIAAEQKAERDARLKRAIVKWGQQASNNLAAEMRGRNK